MLSLEPAEEVEEELAGYKRGSQSLVQLLTHSPLSDAAFDVLGPRSPSGGSYRIAYIRERLLDDFLRCASGTRNPRAGFRHCARHGIELRRIKTAPASRGAALLLGVSNNERNNTDGDRCNSIALRRAGYEALHGRINLYGDVEEKGFHLRLLSALVKMGYFTQDRRTFVVTRGRVLLEFHRLHPRCNMTGSDVYYLTAGISVGSGLSAFGSSIACCWAGVEGQKNAMVRLILPEFHDKYGTASRADIISANHFLPFYDCLFSIHDQNFLHQCEVEDLMAAVAAGRRRGVKLSIVCSATGEESSVRHVFTSDDVRRVRRARTPRLVELSTQAPFQAFLAEAAHLSTRLKIWDGLRGGAADVVWPPHARNLQEPFFGAFTKDGYYGSTLVFTLAYKCRALDDTLLLSKGEKPIPNPQNVGAARARRDAAVTSAARLLKLRARDADRDHELGIKVPMLGAPVDVAVLLKIAEGYAADAVAADAMSLLPAPLQAEARAEKAELREAEKAERARRKGVERRLAVVPPDAGRAPTLASSDYFGVTWVERLQRWQAQYRDADGERHACGCYATQERAAVGRLRRIRRERVERKNRLNPIVSMWFAPRVRKSTRPAPAPAPTRASGRTRTPRVTSDLGAGSTRVEKLKKRKDAPPATAAEDLAVGARVALGGAPGVLTAIEERGWYKVRLDGEETVRSARRTKLKLSKD